LGEAVEIIRKLLDGEEVSFAGEYYTLRGAHTLRSLQEHVPLLVGVNGQAALAHAARHADIIGLTMLGRTLEDGQHHEVRWQPARLDAAIQHIRKEAGRRWERLELHALVQAVVITDNRQDAAATLASRIPGLSVEDALATPFLAIGSHEEMAHHLSACRERWGISYFSVRDLSGFSPVIGLLRSHEK
jgi:alkanesulfonate monooxygenase SsuD/methylene tetrahydromethanopterin reductase-like flavin-dependent oxidoreductase (luciferase family)